MEDFYDLPEEERDRLLEAMACAACGALWPGIVDPLTIETLSLSTNALYTVRGILKVNDDDTSSLYVLRLTDPRIGHSMDDVTAECLWLESLRDETDLVVRAPIRISNQNGNGDLFGTFHSPAVPHSIVTLFSYVEGDRLEDHLDAMTAHAWGRLSAALHQHSSTFELPPDLQQRLVRSDTAFPSRQTILLEDTDNKFITPTRAASYGRLRKVVEAEIDAIWNKEGDPMLIHYDLHTWNVLINKSESDTSLLAAIDFEDLVLGHPIQDVVGSLNDIRNHDDYDDLRRAFRAGYETLCQWPLQENKRETLLLLGRKLHHANYILHNWDDDEDIEEALVAFDDAIDTYFSQNASSS